MSIIYLCVISCKVNPINFLMGTKHFLKNTHKKAFLEAVIIFIIMWYYVYFTWINVINIYKISIFLWSSYRKSVRSINMIDWQDFHKIIIDFFAFTCMPATIDVLWHYLEIFSRCLFADTFEMNHWPRWERYFILKIELIKIMKCVVSYWKHTFIQVQGKNLDSPLRQVAAKIKAFLGLW